MSNKEQYIKIVKNDNIYSLSIVNFTDTDSDTPLLETNLNSITKLISMFINDRIDDYLKLEKMIGNLGTITLSEHMSILINSVIYALSYKKLEGIYVKITAEKQSFDDDITELKDADAILINTIHEDCNPAKEYFYFLNIYVDLVLTSIYTVMEDTEKMNHILDVLLTDDLVANLNDFYYGMITAEEFEIFLSGKSTVTQQNNSNHMN